MDDSIVPPSYEESCPAGSNVAEAEVIVHSAEHVTRVIKVNEKYPLKLQAPSNTRSLPLT